MDWLYRQVDPTEMTGRSSPPSPVYFAQKRPDNRRAARHDHARLPHGSFHRFDRVGRRTLYRHRRRQHVHHRFCCAISSHRIPDSYDFGQLMLGILIFWGIAATSYRGTHITVDLVWGNVGPRYQRMIDVFATLVLLFVVTVQTYTLFDKVVTHAQRQRAHLRSSPADLALLHGGVAWRRFRGAADCGAHLPADLPS